MSQATDLSNRFQERFGEPAETTRGKVRQFMHEWVQEFIRKSPFFVLATVGADGSCDASPRGGKPGFVEILGERKLRFPDVRGNRLIQSMENIDATGYVVLRGDEIDDVCSTGCRSVAIGRLIRG